jgi:hypothetical protein
VPSPNPQARYRLTDADKHTVRTELRNILIQAARNREILTYSELCQRLSSVHVHPHSFVFTHLLRQVCEAEIERGSGMLCALVVSRTTGIPGSGYFRTAAEQGRNGDDLVALWQADVESVFARWADA